ncbi:hypothetical protein [Microbacterium murale]|nr:hypothetical protein [Microbacterium murale]
MTIRETSESTGAVDVPVIPAGLNLLGDDNAGSCCGGSCSLPG